MCLSPEEIAKIVENGAVGIMAVNSQNQICFANQVSRDLLGLAELPIGHNPAAYIPVLANPAVWDETLAGGRIVQECRCTRQDGRQFYGLASLSSYQSEYGRIITIVLSDISELVRIREQIALDRAIANSHLLIEGMRHEIRNLCSATQATLAQLAGQADLTRKPVIAALKSLLGGMQKLVSVSINPPQLPEPAPVDLRAVLEEFAVITRVTFEELGVKFRLNVADNLPLVLGDRHELLQVFLNLAQNARRALQQVEEKSFAVEAIVLNGVVIVYVSNSGPPIERPERLFQPFQAGAEQTGLGLFICRTILQSFSGELSYEPQSHGCSFKMRLRTAASAA